MKFPVSGAMNNGATGDEVIVQYAHYIEFPKSNHALKVGRVIDQ